MCAGAAGEEGGRDGGQRSRLGREVGAELPACMALGCAGAWKHLGAASPSVALVFSGAFPFSQRRRRTPGRVRLPGGLSPSSQGAARARARVSPNNARSPRLGAALDLRSDGGENGVREARPPRGTRGREQDGDGKTDQGPYLCRRFFRFLVWAKADLGIFRSLEETSSESGKRTETCGSSWGALGSAREPQTRGPSPRRPPRGAAGTRSVSPGSLLRGRPHP